MAIICNLLSLHESFKLHVFHPSLLANVITDTIPLQGTASCPLCALTPRHCSHPSGSGTGTAWICLAGGPLSVLHQKVKGHAEHNSQSFWNNEMFVLQKESDHFFWLLLFFNSIYSSQKEEIMPHRAFPDEQVVQTLTLTLKHPGNIKVWDNNHLYSNYITPVKFSSLPAILSTDKELLQHDTL